MSNGAKKTITSGPMDEELSLFGTATQETTVGVNRVDLKVKLDDEVTVALVPQGLVNKDDRVELTLEIGKISIKKRTT